MMSCKDSVRTLVRGKSHLATLYEGQAREERYNVAKELFHMRMSEKDSVSNHGVKFLGLLKRLTDLGLELQNDLAVDLLLSSLPSSWANFVMNFNMNGGRNTPAQLFNKLKTAESEIKTQKGTVLMVST